MRASSATNRDFYDDLWSGAQLLPPSAFNTWPIITQLLPIAFKRLEIGPGLRPRLPIIGSHFVDISVSAIRQLKMRGGTAVSTEGGSLPYPDNTFELVCAFDLIEHADDDRQVLKEVGRVLKEDGFFLFSVPLHARLWTTFDEIVGHVRRYDPDEIPALLAEHNLVLLKSAVYGMQPASPRLVQFGMWWLRHFRQEALWCYNRLIMPLGMAFQKRLELVDGLVDSVNVDEVLMVCRKQGVSRVW